MGWMSSTTERRILMGEPLRKVSYHRQKPRKQGINTDLPETAYGIITSV
jgi:hypothetical protein